MNNIYKVIWSKAKNCYVVASEIAKSHTKSATGSGKIGGVTRRSLLASLMALSFLCGGLGVASASLDIEVVDQSGTPGAVTIYTKEGVDNALASNRTDIDDLKTAVGDLDSGLTKKVSDQKAAIDVNTASIDTNKAAIKSLQDDKLDKALATSTFAAKTELDAKANTDLSNLTADGETKIKNIMSADMNLKANKDTVTALEGRVGGVEGKVTTLETTVGDASSGLVRDVAELRTQGTTLNNALVSKADKSDLDEAKAKIAVNEGNITALQTKTQKINHDVANDTTSVNGMKVGQKQVDMGGKDLTNVGTINGIDLGTKQTGNYISQDGSIWGNMMKVDTQVKTNADAIAKETADRKAAIGELAVDGKYIEKGMNVSDNLVELDKQAKTNADNIQTNADNIKNNKDEIARVNGELVKTNDYFNSELSKTNNHFNTELEKTNAALQATNKRTAGIERTDTGVAADNQTVIEGKVHFDQNGNVSGVKDLNTDTIHATGEITSEGLDAGSGEITTKGKVSAGDVSTGTLKTTGAATIGGDLTVNGKLNVDEISMKNDGLDPNGDQHHSATTITADGISNNAKVTDKNGVTTESKFTHDKEGSTTYAYKGDAADWKESTSNVTADGVENVAKDSKGNNNTFTQTSTDTKNILKDEDGNTSTTRQDSKGIYGYAKDKDGNKSYTKQEGNRIAESVIGQDGKETKSEMTSTDIKNTAKDGTITNTAKNVTNEGTESVTNKVGTNEVKVSQDGVDIKAEDGKKITESVGTASRVVENDKITDKAADSTVTTENGKGTTFGKEGSTGTTNIYGDSIKTGTINAKDTTTDKLTAGAAADADGGRLTVDARDGVKGSYKSGEYTSRSYILANTLKSGVDNGKEPTEDGFVGSRTDHYMDGNKAKLDETVKDADGSNGTNKTSTGTVTTITDGTTTTKTEQGVKDITNTATDGTIKNDAKVITNKASEVINNEAVNINNTATGIITSKASEIQNQADKLISNKVGENTWENMEDGKITTSIKNGTKQNLTQSDAEKTEHSVVNGSNSTVNKQTSEEITDAVTNGTTTNVTQNTATSSNNTIADKSR